MSAEHDCKRPPAFPASIYNRPGLDTVRYRIGDYHSVRGHMLDRLNQSSTLSAWTHREPDDPGIALLEGAAEVGDVLTFYQQLYANEAFLHTAQWRESVADLVALTGYRLAPGLGGDAVFAVAVEGGGPVTVPAGFGFKATLAGAEKPADFEATDAVTTYSALNRFHLYRPRLGAANITRGGTELELASAGGAQDIDSLESVELKAGDRVMLISDTGLFDADGGNYDPAHPQAKPEILVVKETETVLDRRIVRFEGALTVSRGTSVRAYRIDRSFRHYGHAAPSKVGTVDSTSGTYTSASTNFVRPIWGDYSPGSTDSDLYSALAKEELPLDTQVNDLPAGGIFICEGDMDFNGSPGTVHFVVTKTIQGMRSDTLLWGGVSGSSTVVTMDAKLIANDAILDEEADIRRLSFHEAVGPELTLRAPSRWSSGEFSDNNLMFFGTYAQAGQLAGRSLLLVDDSGTVQPLRVTTEVADLSLSSRDDTHPWLWPVTLDQPPRFLKESFAEDDPLVTVYGNLVACTQGKSQSETVLGSGDRRQAFQTFALPKSPLTYLLDESRTPAQVPELAVYVDGLLWKQVDNFFNSGPKDAVYVVRQDADDNSFVQFGDGNTGARLPSGLNNVVAVYRVGTGAAGQLEEGAKPNATGRLKPLTEVYLPAEVVGGGDPESEDNARKAAPGRMQSLGRMVGLADYEAEARALPGVLKAAARWAAPEGTPQVRLAVLVKGGAAAVTKIQDIMNGYNRCRGPRRHPIVVAQGLSQYVYLALRAGYAADRRSKDVDQAIRDALIGDDDQPGLFNLARRGFGQSVHISQILGAVQQVQGVSWAEADACQIIPLGTPAETDPSALSKPSAALLHKLLVCEPDRVLSLYHGHLDISLAQDQEEGCQP